MTNNYLIDEIRQQKQKQQTLLISLVGGGGKTTTLFQLANQLKEMGSVLITTTTAMFHPGQEVHELYYKTLPERTFKKGEIIALYDSYIDDKDKMNGIDEQLVSRITHQGLFDFIIVEADGARRKPLKCYAEHEPVIPQLSQIVMVVLGADAFGEKLSEKTVHRADIFADVTKINVGDTITPEAFINVLTSPFGFLKGIPISATAFVVINKSLSFPIPFDKIDFSKSIFDKTKIYKAILFTEMKDFILEAVYENLSSPLK